ncbi:MAG: hypothetical protein MRZ79_10980 [Bacteroidia bacterium]|nr:hypothetical protein [Bacteroidia bacterium]
MKKLRYILVFLTFIYWQGSELMAQCSQCKAAADQSRDSAYSFESINTAVLYLLALPLFLPFVVGGIWYVKRRQALKMRAEGQNPEQLV